MSESQTYSLISKVVEKDILQRAQVADNSQQFFCFNGLRPECLTAILNHLAKNDQIREVSWIQVCRNLVNEDNIQEPAFITDYNSAYIRNTLKPEWARLIIAANPYSEAVIDTLKCVDAIDDKIILSMDGWLEGINKYLTLPSEQQITQSMWYGLTSEATCFNLLSLEAFILKIQSLLKEDRSIAEAINEALPQLGLPRSIHEIKNLCRGKKANPRAWETFFTKTCHDRLLYFSPNERPPGNYKENLEALKENSSASSSALQAYENALNDPNNAPFTSLLEFEWQNDSLKEFILGGSKTKTKNLAHATRAFFENEHNDLLDGTSPSRISMDLLSFFEELDAWEKSNAKDFPQEFVDFYYQYQEELKESKEVYRLWDKQINQNHIECQDFVSGLLLAVNRLLQQEEYDDISAYKIRITFRKSGTFIYNEFNSEARAYFRLMYKGLIAYSDILEWHISKTKSIDLHNNPFLMEHPKDTECTSEKKEALKLQFSIGLVLRTSATEKSSTKPKGEISLYWSFPKSSIAHNLSEDLNKLLKYKKFLSRVLLCHSGRTTSKKGTIGVISLDEPQQLGTDNSGHLTANLAEKLFFDLKNKFDSLLVALNIATDHPLVHAWQHFFKVYGAALDAFKEQGFVASEIDTCMQAYQALLQALDTLEPVSTTRQPFYELVTSIGVYSFVDMSNMYAIVPPWNPMRLWALKCRFISRMNLIRQMMTDKGPQFSEKGVFVHHLTDENPQYLDPQVVSIPDLPNPFSDKSNAFGKNWLLLKEIQSSLGYTLYTLAANDQNVKRRQVGFNQVVLKAAKEAIHSYLKLYPHEKDNFMIALPDAISPVLPVKLAQALYEQYLKEGGETNLTNPRFTLQVGGINTDKENNVLFEDLSGDACETEALQSMSLIGKSLGSSLRFKCESSPEALRQKGRNCHIAIVERLLSDNSTVVWQEVDQAIYDPMNVMAMPELQNRRYFDYQNPKDAKTFIVTPTQTELGTQYLRVLFYNIDGAHINQHTSGVNKIRLPATQISTRANKIDDLLRIAHDMADWVLICNDFIDKRQLLDSQIEVVRYKTDRLNHRTEIISSKLSIHHLANHLKVVLEAVLPPNCSPDRIAKKLIESSYEISGFIALRAARRDVNARELVGLTLSRYSLEQQIAQILKAHQQELLISATYLLDDYCAWFELLGLESLADLLNIVVSKDQHDQIHLHIWITEAKYVSITCQNECAKKSKQQLQSTVNHIVSRLKDKSGNQYEREIWLHRIADLIQETPRSFHNLEVLQGEGLTDRIKKIANSIRQGQSSVTVNGISHIFTYDTQDEDGLDLKPLDLIGCYQKFYDADAIQSLLYSMDSNEPVSSLDPIEVIDFTDVNHDRKYDLNEGAFHANQEKSKPSSMKASSFFSAQKKSDGLANATERYAPLFSEKATISTKQGGGDVDKSVITQLSSVTSLSPQSQRYAPGFEAFVLEQAKDNEYSQERQQWADQVTRKLTRKLLQKDIRAIEIGHQVTPNGCLIRYRGDDSLTTKAIKALEENLMTTESVKIVFARAALGEFQILVESPTREAISMWAIWKNRSVHRSASGVNLKFAIGLKETDNHILYLSPIEQDPHTLIAGGTGSGKTILAHMLLLDIVATNPSSKMKFYLIDPKKAVDFGPFKRLPHLAAPQITSKEEAIALLKELLAEMNHRLELFESVGAKNLERYNAKVSEDKRLPVLWLVHDEVASWMVDKEYEKMISETLTVLTVQARATGIYLILITQRPDKDVIPMQIRDNLGNRLALKLPTEQSSVIALGNKGAEVLLGKGHLAAKLNNEIIYAQVPFLSEDNDEIQKAIDKIIEFDAQWC